MRTQTADPTAIRENNLSFVLNLIRETGAISRADIVRQTNLSATTVSALANVLLESGFVHEIGMGESSGGRPPILLQFDYKFRHVIGVDMGATHLTVVVMDLNGVVVARQYSKFPVSQDPSGTTAVMQQLIAQVIQEANLAQNVILGVGIAIPAPLEGETLDKLSSLILPAWEGYDLVNILSDALHLPVYLDNDANAGVIAEKWWGYGRSFANLAYIKLGTGVGSGLIVNNQVYRGDGGTAGEIGHTTIDTNGPLCRCGNRGCLESFVGAPAVIAEIGRSAPDICPEGGLTIEAITAQTEHPIVKATLQNIGFYVGIAIANLVNLFNPGLITLGGEIMEAGDTFLDAIRESVQKRAMPKAAQEVTIAVSQLGNDTVAMGAATLAIQHAFHSTMLLKTLKGGD